MGAKKAVMMALFACLLGCENPGKGILNNPARWESKSGLLEQKLVQIVSRSTGVPEDELEIELREKTENCTPFMDVLPFCGGMPFVYAVVSNHEKTDFHYFSQVGRYIARFFRAGGSRWISDDYVSRERFVFHNELGRFDLVFSDYFSVDGTISRVYPVSRVFKIQEGSASGAAYSMVEEYPESGKYTSIEGEAHRSGGQVFFFGTFFDNDKSLGTPVIVGRDGRYSLDPKDHEAFSGIFEKLVPPTLRNGMYPIPLEFTFDSPSGDKF